MANAPKSGRGLDPETLAAYVDGRLPPDERSRVEAELTADPETYEWLVRTMRAQQDVEAMVPEVPGVPGVPGVPEVPKVQSATVIPFHRRRDVRGAVASVLAVAAALALVVRLQPAWWQAMTGPAIDPRFEKLVAAVGEERYVEGRLTGGFKYGPLRSVTRGPGDLSNQNLALLAAAGELQNAAQADPSAENLHAWGVAQLLLGDREAAIVALDKAATLSDGAAMSDLAAAYLVRYESSSSNEDLARALDTIERGLAVPVPPLEAYFTRAVILERLQRTGAAVVAWQNYLVRDPDSAWAAEARRRLTKLRSSP